MKIDTKTLSKKMDENKSTAIVKREVVETYSKQDLIQKKNTLQFQQQNLRKQMESMQEQDDSYTSQIAECDELLESFE